MVLSFSSLFCVALLFLFVCVPTRVLSYYDYQYIFPRRNSSAWSLPRLNLAMTQSLAGSISASGISALEAVTLSVNTANNRGGILFSNTRYAVTVTYLSDESSKDLAYDVYAKYLSNSSLHVLLSSYNTDFNIAALTSLKTQNRTLFSMGSSSNTVFTGYPYVFGALNDGKNWFNLPMKILRQLPGGISTVAIVYRKDVFNTDITNSVKAQLATVGGVTIVTETQVPTTLTAAASPDALQNFFNDFFANSTMPHYIDLVFVICSTTDLVFAARGLKASKKVPKLAVFNQFITETQPALDDSEGWVGAFAYRSDSFNIRSSLAGTVFVDSQDFAREFGLAYPGRSPTPVHGQTAAAMEGMFATLAVAKSLDSDELRRAALSLNGNTFFSKLKYDSKFGHNPNQELIPYQAQNGVVKRIDSVADLLYPFPWKWTLVPTYKQTSAQSSVMWVCVAMLALITFIALFFGYNRKNRTFHAASVTMMSLILLGGTLVLLGAITNLLPVDQLSCTASIWLFNIGFIIAMVSLLLKTFRVYSIFNRSKLTVTTLSDFRLFQYLCVFVLWDVFLLSIRTGVTPYIDHPDSQKCTLTPNRTSHESHLADAIIYIFIVEKALILVAGVILTIRVRNLPSLFNESTHLAVSLYNTIVVSCIWLVIYEVIDFSSNPASGTVVDSIAMLICTSFTIGLLFAPKIIQISLLANQTRSRKSTSQSHTSMISSTSGNDLDSFESLMRAGRHVDVENGRSKGGADHFNAIANEVQSDFQLKIDKNHTEITSLQQKISSKRHEIQTFQQCILAIDTELDYLAAAIQKTSKEHVNSFISKRAKRIAERNAQHNSNQKGLPSASEGFNMYELFEQKLVSQTVPVQSSIRKASVVRPSISTASLQVATHQGHGRTHSSRGSFSHSQPRLMPISSVGKHMNASLTPNTATASQTDTDSANQTHHIEAPQPTTGQIKKNNDSTSALHMPAQSHQTVTPADSVHIQMHMQMQMPQMDTTHQQVATPDISISTSGSASNISVVTSPHRGRSVRVHLG